MASSDHEIGTGRFAPGNKLGPRFAKGWKGGPGNPMARQCQQLRSALAKAVTKDDVKVIAKKLIKQARGGCVFSAREIFLAFGVEGFGL